ncbi:MAG: CvpA family protein [Anaerolineales bacterium]|nr:CvpA family protein [Anaerolineales bacterium]
MVSLIFIFWMYVLMFAVIGAMRGWAKELLVSFSVILALALNYLLKKYVPMVQGLNTNESSLFWIRAWITIALVFFGYQTVSSIAHLASKARKEKLQDALFGGVMGGVNGYLVIGTLWYYLNDTGYEMTKYIEAPSGDMVDVVKRMMDIMPPHILGEPGIYFAVIIAFIFIIVVYI